MEQEIVTVNSSPPKGPYDPAFSEEEFQSRDLFKQIFFVIFKWKRLIVGLFLAFTVASAIAMLLKPPVRTATAKVLFKADRIPLHISGLSSQTSRSNIPQILKSEIELLRSREVLFPVAQKLLAAAGKDKRDMTGTEVADAAHSLANNTVAVALPDTNVIQATFFAPTFQQAEETLRMIIDGYMDHHAMAYGGSRKTLEFYEEKMKEVTTDLRGAEDTLKKTQEKRNIVSIGEQINNQIHMLADRRRALQQVEADTQTIRDRDPLIAKIKGELVTAEIALQDLLQRYTENDRRVMEKKEQLALIKEQLADAEKAVVSSLESQRRTVRAQIGEASAMLAGLRDKKVEIDRLTREVELRKNALMLYGKNLEEARIAAGLEKERLSDLALIEQPRATVDKGVLKQVGILLLASVVGLTLGLAIAFGLEFFSNSLHTEEDVEHYLGLPVLATVPDLRERSLVDRR